MEKQISYSEAIAELELIVTEIEQGEITIDTLSEKVKRAAELIKICKTKLTSTEDDVNKILGEIKEQGYAVHINSYFSYRGDCLSGQNHLC